MKKLIKILTLLLVMSAVTFIACNKENALVEENNSTSQIQLGTYSFNSDIRKIETGLDEYGILSFENEKSYLETLKQLERLSNEFNEKIRGIENEELNYQQVLFDFADQLNFHSLFVDIYKKEQKWLEETDGSDINEDPDNHFVSDYYERSLFNVNNEVVVNDKIYKKLESGHLIIKSLNFDLIAKLRANLDLFNLPQGVEYIGDLPATNLKDRSQMAACAFSKRDSDYVENNNHTRRIKCITEINAPLFTQRNVKATTKNYYCKSLKNDGTCKRWKSSISAQTSATIRGEVTNIADNPGGAFVADCSDLVDVFLSKSKFAKEVEAKQNISFRRTKSGVLHSDHSGVSGITHTNTLFWN